MNIFSVCTEESENESGRERETDRERNTHNGEIRVSGTLRNDNKHDDRQHSQLNFSRSAAHNSILNI